MASRLGGSGSGPGHDTRLAAVRLALWLIGFAVGGWLLWRILTEGEPGAEFALSIMFVVTGCSWLACGLIAWRHRPAQRLGPLMVVLGIAWLVGAAGQATTASLTFTLGMWLSDAWVVLLAYFLVTFPHGRLASRAEALLIVPFAVSAIPLELAWILVLELPPPGNAFLVSPDPGIADAIDYVQRAIYVSATFLVVAVLARRWQKASRPLRRRLTPVVIGAVALLVSNVQLVVAKLTGGLTHTGLAIALVSVLGLVPIAVLVDMLRARLARSGVGELVLSLHASLEPAALRDAIARALGDPSLRVAYWLPEHDAYVDLDGHPVELPADRWHWTRVVDSSGAPVAALLHDPSLHEESALLDAVGAAAGLALERARLHAELNAQVDELRSTRARIVEAAQTERRRLERDLHDGAQQRLVTLALDLGMLESRLGEDASARRSLEQARGELSRSLEELRELARGIHPAVVTGRGLAPALEGLAARTPIPVTLSVKLAARPPEPIEVAAYFMVSECLTNVAKYAHASVASVEVRRRHGELVVEVADDGVGGATGGGGSGLTGLADRIEALGGHLEVTSPTGHGTRVRAEIPCG